MRIGIRHFSKLALPLALLVGAPGLTRAHDEDRTPPGKMSHVERQIKKLNDIEEVRKIMARHAYYHQRGQHQEEWDELWVQETANPVFAQNRGYWIGYEKVYGYYVTYHTQMWAESLASVYSILGVANDSSNYGIGEFIMHPLTTEMIEVAADGKTAKGIWYSPGAITATTVGTDSVTASANWIWERYGVDFVKEHGKWKIWHLHMYTDFMGPVTSDWAASSGSDPVGSTSSSSADDITTPTISETTFNTFSVTQLPQDLPKVPQPYKTFSETFSYGPAGY